MDSLDEIIEKIKEVNPSFNEKDPKKLDTAIKIFCLTAKKAGDNFLYNAYLTQVVEEFEKFCSKKTLEEKGLKGIQARLEMYNFEKEIIERKIKTVRQFLS